MSDPDAIGLCMTQLIKSLPRLEDGWGILKAQLLEQFCISDTPLFEKQEFIESYDQFKNWMLSVLEQDPIPKDIESVIFTVLESEDGLELYLAGTQLSDQPLTDEQQWQDTVEMFPDLPFAALNIYRDLSSLREEHYHAATYLALTIPIVYSCEFIAQSNDHIEMLLRKKGLIVRHRDDLHLRVGFDQEETIPYAILTQTGIEPL